MYDHEMELRRLVRQREVLVQEIHHRVKNNLQTIAGILSFHSTRAENPHVIKALGEAGGRVQAIAQLHESLYASPDLAQVNIGEYLRHLAATLQSLHSRPEITFDIDTADLVVDTDQATALALIANELILNCFKHAFPAGRAGHVVVRLRYVGNPLDNGLAEFEVHDNGAGFPPGLDPEKTRSIGLEIVRLLSRQLRAECKCVAANGVRWTVVFPLLVHEAGG